MALKIRRPRGSSGKTIIRKGMPTQSGHNNRDERGSAIIFLFIAVALFGALSYAFLRGSRGGTTMITGEAAKAASYQSQDCTNAISMAVKRLEMRGCKGLVSYLADGSSKHEKAPADGSCSVFHPNGGGAKPCDSKVAMESDVCKTGPAGTVCESDKAIYIGSVGGRRVYAAPADETMDVWKMPATATAGTDSTIDGLINTNAMAAESLSAHRGARLCVSKVPSGTWYLPSKDELNLVLQNKDSINPTSKKFFTAGDYWSSSENSHNTAWSMSIQYNYMYCCNIKTNNMRIRCVRR